jgi:glutamine synthetase
MGFDSSSIKGFTDISHSDSVLMPDPNTFKIIPWLDEARIICDVCYPTTLKPFEGDPRSLLKKEIQKLAEDKMEFYVGPEIEFHLLKDENGKLVPHDNGGYADFSPLDLGEEIRNKAGLYMQMMGVKSEITHHEVGSGQHEIDFRFKESALEAADDVITYKQVVKNIAAKEGLVVTYMPKPFYGQAGNGMHCHQSLFQNGRNMFYDPKTKNLSDKGRWYIGGILKHAKALTAICSPSVNSYKRLVPGYEAPVYISWGWANRTTLVRLPGYDPTNERALRIEFRSPDPTCNPYLAFTAMLKAGLDGIENQIEPPEPIDYDLFELSLAELEERGIETLPINLGEAIKELEKDKVVKDSLGKHISAKYIEHKKKVWEEYSMYVTDWEFQKYLRY